MTYVYIQTEPKLWTVGHYQSDGNLYPESDHGTPDKAAERAAYLNGALNRSLQSQLLDLRKQYDEMRKDVLGALEELTYRCDGPEGVGADGSNIQTLRAHSVIAKYSSEPTEAQKEHVRKNGVPGETW